MQMEQLRKDMMAAMKARDKERKDAISSLVSAVKKNAIDAGCRDDIPEDMVNATIMKELKTVQLGIRMFISQYGADYAWIMAASVCSLIPVVIVFLSCQKFFVEGVAASGIKG